MTSCTVAVLFLLALPLTPLIGAIGLYLPITAPALVLVGAMMARNAAKIEWDDSSEAIPAFLTMIGIPLSFSIANGIALGLISYPVVKLAAGKGKQIPWLIYVLAAALLSYFILRPT